MERRPLRYAADLHRAPRSAVLARLVRHAHGPEIAHMLTFDNFSGINNVALPESLGANDLVEATNVDIDRQGKLRRRAGYAQLEETCHKNLWQAAGFLLATCDGDLTAIAPNGDRTVIYPSLGVSRVRYCNLPDGRTSFSNGLINGLTDGATMTTWGVPIPAGLGGASDI